MSGWYRISRAGAGRMVSPLQRMVAATVVELLLGSHRSQTDPCVFYHLPHDISGGQGQTFVSHIAVATRSLAHSSCSINVTTGLPGKLLPGSLTSFIHSWPRRAGSVPGKFPEAGWAMAREAATFDSSVPDKPSWGPQDPEAPEGCPRMQRRGCRPWSVHLGEMPQTWIEPQGQHPRDQPGHFLLWKEL